MNKRSHLSVPVNVRLLSLASAFAAAVLFSSCSSAPRTEGADLVAPNGRTEVGTITESDIFIPAGSTYEAAYSVQNRFFVENGGALVGFPKGVRKTTIYAENGALVPDSRRQSGFSVRTVKDASKTYRDRYKELLPAEVEPGTGNTVTPVVGVGVGVGPGWGWGGPWWGGWGWGGGRAVVRDRGFSRPSGVRASSYKRRD